jgi:hypothetical protein
MPGMKAMMIQQIHRAQQETQSELTAATVANTWKSQPHTNNAAQNSHKPEKICAESRVRIDQWSQHPRFSVEVL